MCIDVNNHLPIFMKVIALLRLVDIEINNMLIFLSVFSVPRLTHVNNSTRFQWNIFHMYLMEGESSYLPMKTLMVRVFDTPQLQLVQRTLQELKLQGIKIGVGSVFSRYSCFANDLKNSGHEKLLLQEINQQYVMSCPTKFESKAPSSCKDSTQPKSTLVSH